MSCKSGRLWPAVLIVLLIPVLAKAQPEALETMNRIRLPTAPASTNPDNWLDWTSAEAEEFTWTPPRAFWQGYVKASRSGQKASIFVAIFSPRNNMDMERFDQTASNGFAEDGAALANTTHLEVSGFAADNLIFNSSAGNGQYFTGGHTPTTVSIVHVKLEKEKSARVYPFLMFYLGAPSAVFDEVEPEFEQFVEATYIKPMYGSITGRVVSQPSGIGIAGAVMQSLDSKTSKTDSRVTGADGFYRFDSLLASNYYLTISEVPGFKPLAVPSIIALVSGQDTAGVDFALEPAEVAVAKTKPPRIVPPAETTALRLGIGYRHRWNGVGVIAVNARSERLILELGVGLNLGDALRSYYLVPELGAQYLVRDSDKLSIGLGASVAFVLSNRAGYDPGLQAVQVEIPVTAEYSFAP